MGRWEIKNYKKILTSKITKNQKQPQKPEIKTLSWFQGSFQNLLICAVCIFRVGLIEMPPREFDPITASLLNVLIVLIGPNCLCGISLTPAWKMQTVSGQMILFAISSQPIEIFKQVLAACDWSNKINRILVAAVDLVEHNNQCIRSSFYGNRNEMVLMLTQTNYLIP